MAAAKRRVNSGSEIMYTLPVEGTAARKAVAADRSRRSVTQASRTGGSRAGAAAVSTRRRQVSGAAAVASVRAAADMRARAEREAQANERIQRNRSRALSVSRGYVLFLALMAFLTVGMCVYYLQMKAQVTTQLESNAKLESRLTAITSENDALYETITNSVDWDHVKDVAINKLGMTYATEDQVIWYNIEDSGYVRQFRDVPTGK